MSGPLRRRIGPARAILQQRLVDVAAPDDQPDLSPDTLLQLRRTLTNSRGRLRPAAEALRQLDRQWNELIDPLADDALADELAVYDDWATTGAQAYLPLVVEAEYRLIQFDDLLQLVDSRLALALAVAPLAAAQPLPVAAAVSTPDWGSFDAFEPSQERFDDYLKRFINFCEFRAIPEASRPRALLSFLDPSHFKQITTEVEQRVPPLSLADLTLSIISDLMKRHFDVAPCLLQERHNFLAAPSQRSDESIVAFVARLRTLARYCSFTAIEDAQDAFFLVKFCCGLRDDGVRKALFRKAHDDEAFSFAAAVDYANLRTSTDLQATSLTAPAVNAVDGTSTRSQPRRRSGRARSQSRPPDAAAAAAAAAAGATAAAAPRPSSPPQRAHPSPCPRCAGEHWLRDCPVSSELTCFNCHQAGHMQRACKQQPASHDATLNVAAVNVVQSAQALDPPYLLPVCFAGVTVIFEVDSGTASTFVGPSVHRALGSPTLHAPVFTFTSFSAHRLHVRGSFSVMGRVAGAPPFAVLIHVTERDPSTNLLGRNVLNYLRRHFSADSLLDGRPLVPVASVTAAAECVAAVAPPPPAVDPVLQQRCRLLLANFPDVFRDELGTLKGVQVVVQMKPDHLPVFRRERSPPLAYLPAIDKAIDRGIERGVWRLVTRSDHATPIVPIVKRTPDGAVEIRVCGDYSQTVNPGAVQEHVRLPRPDELLQKLAGAFAYSKIDLRDAYNQLELAPESQQLLTLNTHRGLLRQLRLPFGVTSAVGIFSKALEKVLAGVPGCVSYLDDIVSFGRTADECVENLRCLLQRLQDSGLRIKLTKCQFALPVIDFLGHTLSAYGVSKGRRADALAVMPAPHDVPTLKSFLGSLQFYSKFLPDLSTRLHPMQQLLAQGVTFVWSAAQQRAFDDLRAALLSSDCLVHFDQSLPLVLSVDASPVGVGCVLAHRFPDGSERPIRHASKTLTPTQQRWPQLHREGLAVVYGMTAMRYYLLGRRFTLVTDSKPLKQIFAPDKGTPLLALNRLYRWAHELRQYDYSIEYRPSLQHGNADALSRLPSGADADFDARESAADEQQVLHIEEEVALVLDSALLTGQTVAAAMKSDPALSIVFRALQSGTLDGPRNPFDDSSCDEAKSYGRENVRSCLSAHRGVVLYGSRVCVPAKLQSQVLAVLHRGHFGAGKMKALARTCVYWPGIDGDIEKACAACVECGVHARLPAATPLHQWARPSRPWARVHVDWAGPFRGRFFHVTVCTYSGWPSIHCSASSSAAATIEALEKDFAVFGAPEAIVSDNGPCYTSSEFADFCARYGVTHITSPEYHPATNGTAEKMVQSFKSSVKKSHLPPERATLEFLAMYRRTPHATTGISPAQLMLGREIAFELDRLVPSDARAYAQHAKSAVFHKGRRDVSFKEGEAVWCLSPRRGFERPVWVEGTVSAVLGPRRVRAQLLDGRVWTRHSDHVRPRGSDAPPPRDFDDEPPPRHVAFADEPDAEPAAAAPAIAPAARPPRRSGRARRPPARLDPA